MSYRFDIFLLLSLAPAGILGQSIWQFLDNRVSHANHTIASSDQVASADSMVPTIDDPVVCKRITPIGTRISQKICKKQSDWDQISSVGSAFTEDAQRRSNVGNAVGP